MKEYDESQDWVTAWSVVRAGPPALAMVIVLLLVGFFDGLRWTTGGFLLGAGWMFFLFYGLFYYVAKLLHDWLVQRREPSPRRSSS